MGSTFPGQPLIADCSNMHGYRARRLTKCPRLSVRHRVARLLWAIGSTYRRLHPGHWQHVVFTDESQLFILDRKDGRQRVRRLAGENLREECIHETTQGGGGSVMIWAGIHYGGKTPLVVPDGNVNAAAYRDISQTAGTMPMSKKARFIQIISWPNPPPCKIS
ncbi:uncharacterized protein LOC135157758 [Lytechinus pictus]|uniref:uncharacterized protein LOC135157758 n=1 Tax=Lytechinus pictus TaxID=7653 RepID=UPI0030BA2495